MKQIIKQFIHFILNKKIFILIITVLAITIAPSLISLNNSKPDSVIYFRLAEIHPPNHPTTQTDYEFVRLVKEKTQGRIVIKVYDSEQLGPEKAILDQLQMGSIDFARMSMGQVAGIQPKLNVLQLPYIYRDSDHMWNVLNSDIGETFLQSVSEKDLIGLAWYDAGARNFYNSVREIKTIDDLKGLKFRVMESQLMMDMARELGLEVIPMPFGEVYSAIQKGEIDGAENNYPSYDTSLQYEVAKYYSEGEHIRVPEILIASNTIMNLISESDLEIIKTCAKESQTFQRKRWKEQEIISKAKLQQSGCIITTIENRSEFEEAMQPLYDLYARDYADVIKRIKEMD